MPTSNLAWQDNVVLLTYLAGMIGLGIWLGRRKRNDDEYFLASRRMPWFAVGISVIASILSSITYLSEPGEVWKSGTTHIAGKMLAIPFEMLFVWLVCIPFLMKFKFTSAYEYLGKRFGDGARLTGVGLFILLVILWMGVVVHASAIVLSHVTGMSLMKVIVIVGIVATIYTCLGGLRAVIWTDVIQVVLLIGGGLFTIGYVMYATGTWLPDWFAVSTQHLTDQGHEAMPIFSLDPKVRATVVTVAVNMFVWHVCTHLSNQMTVQRYFSTSDARAARRSFVTGSLFGVGINLMLMVTGLALLYYYVGQQLPVDGGLDPATKQRDQIFPTFAVNRLPPGVGGAILAALVAAAMSTIDSGVNSIATVVTVEVRKRKPSGKSHVKLAMIITIVAGGFIIIAASLLNYLPKDWGIVDALPRTFNAVTAPLGGLFLTGMFFKRVSQPAALIGVGFGMATSILLGYSREFLGLIGVEYPGVSFTWIMPSAVTITVGVAFLASFVFGRPKHDLSGLTWRK